jgi:hypothetical protein
MPHPTAELQRLADRVEIRSCTSGSVAGEFIELTDKQAGGPDFADLLSSALYRRLYCRPQPHAVPGPPDLRAARVFIETLSNANGGNGCWDADWTVERADADGMLQLRKVGQKLRFWAFETEFRPDDGEHSLAATGRVRIGKELREMLPGFYMALGEADRPSRASGQPRTMTRFYWHLTAQAAVLWLAELTRRFNAAAVPFEAKVLSDPGAYWRADAGVLYIDDAWRDKALALLPDLHRTLFRRLRPATPMFTRRLAPGLAMAEDPGDGQSFGQHRCSLVAKALQQAYEEGLESVQERAAAIMRGFTRQGLDAARPWLNPGSADKLAWPTTLRAAR